MRDEVIPVFFTVDNSYVPYLDCAVRSMIQNASKDYSYRIIVLYENVPEENLNKLRKSVKEPFQIQFVEMKEKVEGLSDRVENRLRCDYFTMTIYFRLFIADMFPEFEKAVYIDSDVIVPGDISKMYHLELVGNLIGACPDHSVADIPELARYMEKTIGVDKHEYINSGVLLMNLKKMREVEFSKRFLYLLNQYHFDCIAPDQDYLNAMCKGNILFLDECWDAMPPEGARREPLENPELIHYNLFQKPWCYDDIPYAKYFWKYAKDSPFYSEILANKENYSEKQKKSDRECLDVLIRKAGVLDQGPVTFCKVQKNGEQIKYDNWR